MKKLLITFATMVLGVAIAGEPDSQTLSVTSQVSKTNTVVSTQGISGRVHAIDFKVVNTAGVASTGACAVAISSGNITLFNGTVQSGGIYYPRIQTHNTAGVALGVSTNLYERILVVQDRMTITAIEAAGVTNTVTARIMLDK